MYEKSPTVVRLELRASPALMLFVVAAHAGALLISLLLPFTVFVRFALAAAIVFSLYRGMMRHALRRSVDAPVAFELHVGAEQEGECAVRFRGDDTWFDGRVVDRWVQPWLTILVLRCSGRRWPVAIVITRDAVEGDAFRRLRVGLTLDTAAG